MFVFWTFATRYIIFLAHGIEAESHAIVGRPVGVYAATHIFVRAHAQINVGEIGVLWFFGFDADAATCAATAIEG